MLDIFDRARIRSIVKNIMADSTSIKNNLTATRPPTATDDKNSLYTVGSIWVYDNTTYTCVDNTEGHAVWQSSTDIIAFDTWAQLVAAISVLSPSYIGKYALVANANGAPDAGITYTAPEALTDYIADGGSATIKINAQGENYSTSTMPRTITNPTIKLVMLISGDLPTEKGYYIFAVAPTGGLPSGINLNDIAYYDGSTWSVWQTYSQATIALVATSQTGLTQVTWRKFAGTWMSTADEYIPDGKEYQTGKLHNGKPVYRKCISGTTGTVNSTAISTGITVPTTGKRLVCMGEITRSTGTVWTITTQGVAPDSFNFAVLANGDVVYGLNQSSGGGYTNAYNDTEYTVWSEYTKS